jgi:hypothetical protein
MDVLEYPNWRAFRDDLLHYASEDRLSRDRRLFRGLRDSAWGLETTLDRTRTFRDDVERAEFYKEYVRVFRREAVRIDPDPITLPDGEAFERLARHHGVPSPVLDWSESPYIDSYFAFEGAAADPPRPVAVWILDRSRIAPAAGRVNLIDDPDLLRFNRRALRQRGLFTRVLTCLKSVEVILADALTKLTIPASEREVALADLDAMAINAATLFGDLDGAARTATYRLTNRDEIGP